MEYGTARFGTVVKGNEQTLPSQRRPSLLAVVLTRFLQIDNHNCLHTLILQSLKLLHMSIPYWYLLARQLVEFELFEFVTLVISQM